MWFSSSQCRLWYFFFCPGTWARPQTWLPIPYIFEVNHPKNTAHPAQPQRKWLQLTSSTTPKCHSLLNLLLHWQPKNREGVSRWIWSG